MGTKEYFKKGSENEITRFEKACIIGSRSLQIAHGAPVLVKISDEEMEAMKHNPREIAKKEFEAGKIPITVKRSSIRCN